MECAGRRRVCPDMGGYIFDQRRSDEHERLACMELLWDPGTRTVLESFGIGPGWRCLEIGAGAGSIARWLAEKVWPDGEVLATDISTRHLDWLAEPNLQIRQHDILNDPLPDDHFDLAHARLVVAHLGRRSLERAVAAIRPGGWLVLEDHEWGAALSYPDDERHRHVIDGIARFLSRAGSDAWYGRRLMHELERAGLQHVAADGRIRVYRGGTVATTYMRLNVESLSAGLLQSGELMPDDLVEMLAALDDPDRVFLTPMIAAWGRKPVGIRV